MVASFDPPTYEARWEFNSSTGKYERWQAGDTHTDDDGARIAADTVIVQRVQSVAIDELGRRKVDTTGRGDALVFRDGVVIVGEWQKDNRTDRTRFFDRNSEEIALKPGVIWVAVVGRDGDATYE